MSARHLVLSISHDEPARTMYARVRSWRSGNEYTVTCTPNIEHCDCMAALNRRRCDHLDAVAVYLSEREQGLRSGLNSLRVLALVPPTGTGSSAPAPVAAPLPAPARSLASSPSCLDEIPDNAVDECIAAWEAWKGTDVRERMRRAVWQFFAWQSRQDAREVRRARMADAAARG